MEQLLQEMVPLLEWAHGNVGWLGVTGVCLMFSIRIFRLDVIQAGIPPWMVWIGWPQWLKWVLPFVVSFAGMLILKVGMGGGWAVAIAGAIISAVMSVAGHKATKILGEIEGTAKTGKMPGYQPSKFREVGSIIIPIAKHIREAGLPPKE